MAVIQKLRNSGIVVIVIIAALILFVVGDILTGSKLTGLSREDQTLVGTIFGTEIHEKDVQDRAQEVYQQVIENNPDFKFDETSRKQIFEQAWSDLVRTHTFEAQIAKAGIAISDADLNEMLAGENPLEAIKGDPNFQTDNRFDPKKVEQIFRQAKKNPQMASQLASYLKRVKSQTIETRYSTYVSKALYTPKTEKQYDYVSANQGVTGKIVAINYTTVGDAEIKVTESDLQKYLDAHKEEYKQDFESRDIQYAVMDIIPSSKDSADIKEQAEATAKSMADELKPDTAGEGVTPFQFVRDLGKDSAEKAMYLALSSMKVNAVLPPVFGSGKYTIVQKLAEQFDTADAYVKVAHVLIPTSGELPNKTVISDSVMAEKLANDLLAKARGGADMKALAKDYSTDPGVKENSGVYDWAQSSKYVPEFGKFCRTHKAGETGVVKTQFGYHVMKMLADPDNHKVKLRKKEIEITAGQETIRKVDQLSRKVRNAMVEGDAKSFEAALTKNGLIPRAQKDIKTDDRNIPGVMQVSDVKQILYWLFDNKRKTNDISDVFTSNTQHLILIASKVRHAGYAEVKDVKDKIEPLVKNELKAAKIKEKFEKAIAAGAKTPEELAQKTGGALVPMEGLKFASNFIPQLFNEPRVLGTVFGVKEKTMSKPVAGANAVAVVYVEKRDNVELPKTAFNTAEMDFASQPQYITGRIQEVLRKAAKVQDNRYKFEWN
ncbi:MAG: peptidylprolyl isomerase [Bacteroidetes bacterium]|nr:peptidylprolyl isomerase [Bacteroidota bacterium]